MTGSIQPFPLELSGPVPWLNRGDIVTVAGAYTRPPATSMAWWAILLFGAPFAVRHIARAFRRKVSDPFYHFPARLDLFRKRELQRYVIVTPITPK